MSEEEKTRSLEDEFAEACASLALEGTEQVLKQLTDAQIYDVGRAVVREFVRAALTKHLGRELDILPAMLEGEATLQFCKKLLAHSGKEKLELSLDISEANAVIKRVIDAQEPKQEGETAEREFADGEYLPTDEDAGQVMFSAEDPAAAEGACETEGGAQ